MFRSIKCVGSAAVSHLPGSLIMQTHGGEIRLSTDKPNVVVGPNGSGKSALMTALSLATLTHFTPQSMLDNAYLNDFTAQRLWSKSESWLQEPEFLPGIELDWDFAPGLFFRPNHIPGNDHSVSAAMMCGYFDEARAFGQKVKNKSSGQAGQALLAEVHEVLSGVIAPKYDLKMWSHGAKAQEVTCRSFNRESMQRANVFISRYLNLPANIKPVVLMDEPEQSLDAVAELKLWRAIEAANMESLQVIVATHSIYPMLHPERFNLIEATTGYVQAVKSLI